MRIPEPADPKILDDDVSLIKLECSGNVRALAAISRVLKYIDVLQAERDRLKERLEDIWGEQE